MSAWQSCPTGYAFMITLVSVAEDKALTVGGLPEVLV